MKLIFAPMATLSHAGMRNLISTFGGCDEYYTEMIHAASFMHGGKFEPYYGISEPTPDKLVWQLTGSNGNDLAKCAALLMEKTEPLWNIPKGMHCGDKRAIGIDINMGCSAPEIYKQGAGAAWMTKPFNETATMLSEVRSAFSGRLSCKIRLGEDTKDGVGFSESYFFEYLDMLVQNGVTQIVLHPRTRKQKTSRPPRYKYIEEAATYVHKEGLKRKSVVTLIGNGNIVSPADYEKFCQLCPDADGLMIGRGAIQKPWLFSQIAKIHDQSVDSLQKIDLYELAVLFIDNLQKFQPTEFHKTRAQRFFTYYCDNFSFSHHIRKKILNAETIEEMLSFLAEYFVQMPNERFVMVM
jgi:tRNA-dihydrouridine synthase